MSGEYHMFPSGDFQFNGVQEYLDSIEEALKKRGHVVAITGDGTNDAPTLLDVDIGLVMGIQGSEVKKESLDIIILDDNFGSVGRLFGGVDLYMQISISFVQFQLIVNVATLVINVVATLSCGEVLLNAVELLWVNFIMDTLGALALVSEPPGDHLMKRTLLGRRRNCQESFKA